MVEGKHAKDDKKRSKASSEDTNDSAKLRVDGEGV